MYFQDYMNESFDQGKKKKAIEDAKSFYANGVSIELIAKSLNMTIEQVKEFVSDVTVVVWYLHAIMKKGVTSCDATPFF